LGRRALRFLASLAGVALVTFAGYRLLPVNATTIGFAYLLLVLIVASLWGIFEASVASIAATLTFTAACRPRSSPMADSINEFCALDPDLPRTITGIIIGYYRRNGGQPEKPPTLLLSD